MKAINVGICGLGTVGYGSYCLLQQNKAEILRRSGKQFLVTHIATRKLKPGQDVGDVKVSQDLFAVVTDPEVDIVLELIGGYEPARELVLAAIENGKHVVTANKALIAVHGNEIFSAARAKNVSVAYEASVAGGIPIVKAIREGLVGNQIQWLSGIINGTGNYILTEMEQKGRDFADALAEAQSLGYAEADPTFDVGGIDSAHKLAILASISFGIPLHFEKVYTEGISEIRPEDFTYADQLGYRIKHLGISKKSGDCIELRVHPTLISKNKLLANVSGIMNAVMVNGDAVGSTVYYGAGAGAEPTASAIMADIVDIARVMAGPDSSVASLGFEQNSIIDLPILKIEEISCACYLRISVRDEVGVLADITEVLGEYRINIEAVIQKEPILAKGVSQHVPIIILTHEKNEAVMNQAIAAIEKLDAVVAKVNRIRVDQLDG